MINWRTDIENAPTKEGGALLAYLPSLSDHNYPGWPFIVTNREWFHANKSNITHWAEINEPEPLND